MQDRDTLRRVAATQRLRAAVAGSTGYIGMQCVTLLAAHPNVDLVTVLGHSTAGRRYSEAVPGSDVDIVVGDGLDLVRRLHLRHDDHVCVRGGREIVAPPRGALAVDPDGEGATGACTREVLPGGLLVGNRDAVLQVDDDLVGRQLRSLALWTRARLTAQ